MCGEQEIKKVIAANDKGSPPRVRGTGVSVRAGSNITGITPACAGNSYFQNFHHRHSEDHPRVCGEQHLLLDGARMRPGSPPRVRGTGA